MGFLNKLVNIANNMTVDYCDRCCKQMTQRDRFNAMGDIIRYYECPNCGRLVTAADVASRIRNLDDDSPKYRNRLMVRRERCPDCGDYLDEKLYCSSCETQWE